MTDTTEGRALLAVISEHHSGDVDEGRAIVEDVLAAGFHRESDALDTVEQVRHALKRLGRFDSGERATLVAPFTETVVVPDHFDHHETITRGTQISQPYAHALEAVVSNIEDALRALDGDTND